ncbi:GNAT family N-acetyltransferase [Amycolatopsis nigrescens]|uniref:GNAT family N-acetyltransferase n=1 Tax=Amycolatopsis nigrescens TaxID=381445 RepID=UPI000370554A|nr:GNAT family N-acetyltransferase [Amycolatopsis nigrescens]
MLEIRRIREDEGPAVARLWDRLGRELPGGDPMTSVELRRVEHMLSAFAWHERAFCLIAVREGRIAGFVNSALSAGDGLLPGLTGEIETCYVTPEERRRGIGTALAKAAMAWLREHGAGDPIRLETWLHDGDAKVFWASLGFAPETICMTHYAT